MKKGNFFKLTTLLSSLFLSGFPSCSSLESILKKGEYVVPDDVLINYISAVSDPFFLDEFHPGAIQISNPIPKILENEFEKSLKNYTAEQKNIYMKIFTTKKNIIIPEKLLDSPFLISALRHERLHREFENLKENEPETYQRMMDFARELLNYKTEQYPDNFIEENQYPIRRPGRVLTLSRKDQEEFLVYLSEGAFVPRVEKALSQYYLEVYTRFLKIKEKIK